MFVFSGKRGCEMIDVKRIKNIVNMLEENSGNSLIIIINNVVDWICVRVEWVWDLFNFKWNIMCGIIGENFES